MNSKAQPEFHPDADLLSAFAEHALPDTDHARVLAHMAGCARCREVVYLAQAAAAAEMAPPATVETVVRPGWLAAALGKWRVALVSAAALAAVGGIVLWVQSHPALPPTQTARIAALSPSPSNSGTVPVALPPQPLSSAPSAAPMPAVAPPRPAPLEAKKAKRPSHNLEIGLPGEQESAQNNPASALSIPATDQPASAGIHLDGHSASMARLAPPPQPVRPPNSWVSRSPHSGPEWNQQQMVQAAPGLNQSPAPLAPRAPQPAGLVAVQGQLETTAALEPAQVIESSRQLERANKPADKYAILLIAHRTRLPSGLHAVSTAAILNRLVAVDSAGAVFLSQDEGKHWETVTAQWTGKAIAVQAPPETLFMRAATPSQTAVTLAPPAAESTTPDETAPSPPASPPAAASEAGSISALASARVTPRPVPPGLFTLVTDRHQTWVSSDGKVWREPRTNAPPAGTP